MFRDEYQSAAAGTAVGGTAFGLQGTGDRLIQARNPDGNALVNAYNSATDSMKQQFPEHCWNGMKDNGTPSGFNYGTSTAAKYINQGETGIDTGGPCFPEHCSSCPVPTGTLAEGSNAGAWTRCTATAPYNQISAVAAYSGATGCKGRGSAAVACAFNFPYLKFPNPCPDQALFTTQLKTGYSGPANSSAAARDVFQQYTWNMEGIYASVDKAHKMVEGVTTVTKAIPALSDSTGSATSQIPPTVEVGDAVALCGIRIRPIGYTADSTEVLLANAISIGDVSNVSRTITITTDVTAANMYFAATGTPSTGPNMPGFPSTSVTASNLAYIIIDQEIIAIQGISTVTLTVATGGRGAFGTAVANHDANATVRAVEV